MAPRPLLLALLAAPAVAQHNVLLVVMDDVGVDSIATYAEGSVPANTPVLDALAQSGVLFRNCWSNPICSPTRATLLTGRYGFRTGIGYAIGDAGFDLPLEEWILPEVLAAGSPGHASAGFGKWHLTNRTPGLFRVHPNVSGFEHWAGTWSNFQVPYDYSWWIRTEDGRSKFETKYPTTDLVDSFLDWHAQTTGPWFAYLSFHAAHQPWHTPPAHLHSVTLPNVDPRDDPVPFYRATVEAMDAELGRLLAALRDELVDTHVIVVGDNGTPKAVSVAPFKQLHAKPTPYEGGINVPLIVAGPSVVEPGRESAALVNTTDLFTTVIELAGYVPDQVLPAGHVHDSVSLTPYLTDPAQQPLRPWAFAEIWSPNGHGPKTYERRILRDDRYKVIRSGVDAASHTWALFDLERDPFEQEDLLLQAGGLGAEQQARFDALKAELDLLLSGG